MEEAKDEIKETTDPRVTATVLFLDIIGACRDSVLWFQHRFPTGKAPVRTMLQTLYHDGYHNNDVFGIDVVGWSAFYFSHLRDWAPRPAEHFYNHRRNYLQKHGFDPMTAPVTSQETLAAATLYAINKCCDELEERARAFTA